jgi:hypothetical protein
MLRRGLLSSVRLVSGAKCPSSLSRAIASSPILQYGRARAIELKYHDGTCTLAVPLPLSGFDEERVFSLPPGTVHFTQYERVISLL